jgi:hypothetical protein
MFKNLSPRLKIKTHAMITQYEDRGDIPATEATRLRAALATDARTGLVEVRKVRLAVLRNRA